MIVNSLVILFLLVMILWWWTQGFFSALLHLGLVIIAGSLAFAFWEPLAYILLGIDFISSLAWGVALVGLFVICLVILRLFTDYFVKMNMQFVNLVNNIGGGICGLGIGVLTAGIAIIGLGFLPLPVSMAGYQPFMVSGGGEVIEAESGHLWVPVDRIAGNFFSALSTGAFSPTFSNASLATSRPQPHVQAALSRLRYDPNASSTATPENVQVGAVYRIPAGRPDTIQALNEQAVATLGEALTDASNQLVVIDTLWTKTGAAYDLGTLRLPPTQVRLTASTTVNGNEQIVLHAPVAFSANNPSAELRNLYPIENNRIIASTALQDHKIAWAFVIPTSHSPKALFVRKLRFELPRNIPSEPQPLAALLGKPLPAETETAEAGQSPDQGPTVEGREGMATGHIADEIEVGNRLPAAFTKNAAVGLEYVESSIRGGRATVRDTTRRAGGDVIVNTIYTPDHLAMVRLRLEEDRARSFLGASVAAAAALDGVWLEDNQGNRWDPIGYVWKKETGELEVSVNLDSPIRSASQLPVRQMGPKDEIFLYFHVQKGITIDSYHMGSKTQQQVNLQVPAQ